MIMATYGYPLVGGEERVVVADDAEVLHLDPGHLGVVLQNSSIRRFVITEKNPTRAFSWLKAATTAFTFKTL